MPPVVDYAGIVLLLIASAAGVIGYFKANVSKSTIDLYKEDNEALRARLLTLEEQGRQDRAEIDALKSAHKFLTGVVTQADAIAHLSRRIEDIAVKVGA